MSHSRVMPTTESPSLSAYRISVAEGNSEQICISAFSRIYVAARNLHRDRGCSARNQISKHKRIALDDFAHRNGYRAAKHRPGASEGVKLPVLAARIHARW